MRMIDADALEKAISVSNTMTDDYGIKTGYEIAMRLVEDAPTIEPERKKDTIQEFHDYQVLWLLSHYDLKLEPQLEEWFMRFLHDTANCYMTEIDAERNDGRR